jgi:hypothetical protein
MITITGNIISNYNQNEEVDQSNVLLDKNDWLPYFFLLSFSVLCLVCHI